MTNSQKECSYAQIIMSNYTRDVSNTNLKTCYLYYMAYTANHKKECICGITIHESF